MTTTEASVTRPLRRSAPLLEDVVFHDADRVAVLLIERLYKGASKLGYRLSPQEQRLLASAVEMYSITQGSVYTADFELKAKRPARPRTPTRNGKRPDHVQLPLTEDNGR